MKNVQVSDTVVALLSAAGISAEAIMQEVLKLLPKAVEQVKAKTATVAQAVETVAARRTRTRKPHGPIRNFIPENSELHGSYKGHEYTARMHNGAIEMGRN